MQVWQGADIRWRPWNPVRSKGQHWRWLGGALRLMLQSPLRFGILIAVLAFINTSAAKQLQGFAVPQVLFEWAGLACLPLVWTLVSALARGAENGGKTWPVLLDFVRNLYDHLGPGRSDPLVVSRVVSALRERREAVEELGTRHIPGYIRKRVTAVVRQD